MCNAEKKRGWIKGETITTASNHHRRGRLAAPLSTENNMIVDCNCPAAPNTAAAYQDKTYGTGQRVANVGGKTGNQFARCTCCKREHSVTAKAVEKAK